MAYTPSKVLSSKGICMKFAYERTRKDIVEATACATWLDLHTCTDLARPVCNKPAAAFSSLPLITWYSFNVIPVTFALVNLHCTPNETSDSSASRVWKGFIHLAIFLMGPPTPQPTSKTLSPCFTPRRPARKYSCLAIAS